MTEYRVVGEKLWASELVKIPEERLGVVIGKKGEIKREIERHTGAKIKVTQEGIQIEGLAERVEVAKAIVKAIGRGFSPERAFNLLKPGWKLEIISLKGETPKTIKRLFGRVIGRKGTARLQLEKLTGSLISVYGSTVAIIGDEQAVSRAYRAVQDLLEGKSHERVYRQLKKRIFFETFE